MSELAILGLLRLRPMHGYEIQSIIQQSKMDDWAHLLSGSIYYAINKLEKEHFIEPHKEERNGSKIRVIYRITKKGEDYYRKLLYEKLGQQPHSVKSDFMLALSMIDGENKEEIISVLKRNLEQLRASKQEWESRKANKKNTPAYGRLMEFCFDSTIDILNMDIKMLEDVIQQLETL